MEVQGAKLKLLMAEELIIFLLCDILYSKLDLEIANDTIRTIYTLRGAYIWTDHCCNITSDASFASCMVDGIVSRNNCCFSALDEQPS